MLSICETLTILNVLLMPAGKEGFTASASLLIVLLDGPEVWQPWKAKPSFLFMPGRVYLIATGTESWV